MRNDTLNLIDMWLQTHQVGDVEGDSPPPTAAPGMGPGITDPSGIHLQGARYVWNRTELLNASADPNVNYLMGNKCPLR